MEPVVLPTAALAPEFDDVRDENIAMNLVESA
jgi:hypothetical protein